MNWLLVERQGNFLDKFQREKLLRFQKRENLYRKIFIFLILSCVVSFLAAFYIDNYHHEEKVIDFFVKFIKVQWGITFVYGFIHGTRSRYCPVCGRKMKKVNESFENLYFSCGYCQITVDTGMRD